ncbi:DUF3179 domain-containing protein [Loktanella sp. S4079]|uniref:DUF3179 domain-containing protein n=1 Tax=Loktanella sp. S4079 TaxID=579483 RepID=UPI0005FA46BA|nr:DUF3179 domain-containing protein [Loktanella sp. S4079]KJZ20308.1 hypothetical protein TW80_05710 [Loktanella sp. S4079]
MRIIRIFIILLFTARSVAASPEFWAHEWPETDFANTSVESWIVILSGGPSKDGIPAIDDPDFIPANSVTQIEGKEPVLTVEMDGFAPRAYPIRYLIWHEIVNDHIGGLPIAVTYCPLCNSGIVFDRRTDVGTLRFGVTGKLRHSDMIMYDHETQSWWQQAIGEAIVGELTGTTLRSLPAWMESWESFLSRNPDGRVMAQPAFDRAYGRNPYVSYDSSYRPFLYSGEFPPHDIPPLERVVRVGERAWPLSRLADEQSVTEQGITITWVSGQASALDQASIGAGRDIGNIRVKDSAGRDIAHDVMFAFAFHAFWPDGHWMLSAN